MPEAIPPQPCELEWPGRWIAEPGWPPANRSQKVYLFSNNRLTKVHEPAGRMSIQSMQTNGSTAGVWCPYGTQFGMPLDQRTDDALSLSFTSEPLGEAVEILGFPKVQLTLHVDQPQALLAVRLCDVAPDGVSRLVSWGLLNLTHREGHSQPAALEAGQVYQVSVQLNVVAHRLAAGHCWRVAVSPTYWPHAWPSPAPVKLTMHTGSDSRLILPLRLGSKLDKTLQPFASPEGAPVLEYECLRPESSRRTLSREIVTNTLKMVDVIDDGRNRILNNGILYDSVITNTFTITEDNPLSARVVCERQVEISRQDWHTRVETRSVMTADSQTFHLTNTLDAYEDNVRVFTKSWSRSIPRQGV